MTTTLGIAMMVVAFPASKGPPHPRSPLRTRYQMRL